MFSSGGLDYTSTSFVGGGLLNIMNSEASSAGAKRNAFASVASFVLFEQLATQDILRLTDASDASVEAGVRFLLLETMARESLLRQNDDGRGTGDRI